LEKWVTFERNSDTHVLNAGCKYGLNMANNNPSAYQTRSILSGCKLFSNILSAIKSLIYDTEVFKPELEQCLSSHCCCVGERTLNIYSLSCMSACVNIPGTSTHVDICIAACLL